MVRALCAVGRSQARYAVMWWAPFSLLLGGGRWLKVGLVVAVLGVMGSLVLWVKVSESKAARLAAENAMLESERASLRKRLDEVWEERNRALRLVADLQRKASARRNELERLRKKLAEIPDEGCLDRPVPADVDRLLR